MASYLAYILFTGICIRQLSKHYKDFRKKRSSIQWRIHVNGIRGKSTTTRYIASLFRESGYRTFAKTTGSAARIILPDGSEKTVERRGPANINEQIGILTGFSKQKAEAAVVECMAINPTYAEWLEQKIMHSTIGVITNIRRDHTDYLGDSLPEIAQAMARSIPYNSLLITAESNPSLQKILKEEAEQRGSRILIADSNSVTAKDLKDFDHFAMAENVAIAYAVADQLALPRERALKAMQEAKADPGSMTIKKVQYNQRTLYWANLFAVNDEESFVRLCEHLFTLYPNAKRQVILNNRHDRQARVRLFADLALRLSFESIITFGDFEKEVRDIASDHRKEILHCGNSSPLKQADGPTLLREISNLNPPGASALLIGAVNIHTPQANRLLEIIARQE